MLGHCQLKIGAHTEGHASNDNNCNAMPEAPKDNTTMNQYKQISHAMQSATNAWSTTGAATFPIKRHGYHSSRATQKTAAKPATAAVIDLP